MTHVSQGYIPRINPSTNLEELKEYLDQELQDLGRLFISPEFSEMRLTELHAAPEKVFEGLMVFADGTDWDPGSGAGLYHYRGGWVKVG